MWKTNNLGTFPAEIPVRVFPTRRWKLQGHPRNREATGLGDRAALRMYRPICKQSNLDSPGNIIFLRYLLSRQFTSSLPPPPPLSRIRDSSGCNRVHFYAASNCRHQNQKMCLAS